MRRLALRTRYGCNAWERPGEVGDIVGICPEVA